MAKFEVTKFGDSRGVGAVLTVSTWFGTTTWTVLPGDTEFTDEWVCRETGKRQWAGIWAGDYIYKAQYRTQEITKRKSPTNSRSKTHKSWLVLPLVNSTALSGSLRCRR